MQLLRAMAYGAGTASFPDLHRLIGLWGSLLGDRRDRMASFLVSSLPIGTSRLMECRCGIFAYRTIILHAKNLSATGLTCGYEKQNLGLVMPIEP